MLPRPLTSFIGRGAEAHAVRAGVAESPVVTVVGPPGVGKTRLAIEVAAASGPVFGDRVWFVELAPLASADADLVAPAVLAAVGAPARGGDTVAELLRYLGDEPALLVLDNCEHLREAVAGLALSIADACPGAHLLATSRSELGLAGGRIVAVEPFPAAESGRAGQEAVSLFLDRARSSGAALADDTATRERVAAICARLDGLPLAIELAAARARTLGLEQLGALLDRPLEALSGARLASPPQRSLRDSIAWSHRLCSPEERRAWEALAVFAGSFDLPAAVAVLDAEAAIELVEALVAQSILLTAPAGDGVRYRLLETLRAYGLERLRERGEEDAARDRHVAWYAGIGAALETEWVGPGQAARLERAARELDNLREAADHVLSTGRRPELLRGLVALPAAELWWTTGRLDEGLFWLRRTIDAHREPDELRVRALVLTATFAFARRLLEEGMACLRELRALTRNSTDPYVIGARAFAEGFGQVQAGDPGGAVETLRAGLRVADEHEELIRVRVRARQILVFALNGLGRDADAAVVCRELAAIAAGAGDEYYRAFADQMLALYAWRAGDREAARRHADAALRASLDFADRPENADLLLVSALLEERWGDRHRAAALMSAAGATDTVGLRPGTIAAEDVDRVVARLSGRAADQDARRLGASLTAREAIAFALDRERPGPGRAPSPLTARELEVARLIALGLANKQIAAELGLSPKTVEGHIARTMAKLGATSRVQIATWVSLGGRRPAGV